MFNPGENSPFEGRATNSKDKNRVFDPSGCPQKVEFASMADAGKSGLCLFGPCHPTWDLSKNFQRTRKLTTKALCKWLHNGPKRT
jgi:hypothetical protein